MKKATMWLTPLSIIYISTRHKSPYYFNSKICIPVSEQLELKRVNNRL